MSKSISVNDKRKVAQSSSKQTKKKKPQNKLSLDNQIFPILTTLFSTAFIVLGTIIAIYYIKGYRLTSDGSVERTGVISVNTNPAFSSVYLDEKQLGRSPQTESSVEVGQHSIRVERDGYKTWSRNIAVFEGKSTPLSAYLYKNEIAENPVLKIDETIVNILQDQRRQNLFILATKTTETNQIVKIYRYNTKSLPLINSDTTLLLDIQIALDAKLPSMEVSPNGQNILLSFTETTQEDLYSGDYLLVTNSTQGKLNKIPSSLTQDAMIKWNQNSNLLSQRSKSPFEITEITPSNFASTLLYSGDNESLIWTTDENGVLYYVQEAIQNTETEATAIKEQESTYQYNIMAVDNNGESQQIIDTIYSQKSGEYIQAQELQELQAPFTNSQSNTRFAGQITSIKVDDESKSIIITTDIAMYRYDLVKQMYTLIDNKPGSFITFDSEKESLLFTDEYSLKLFIFKKEDADPITKLGTSTLVSFETLENQYPQDYLPEKDYSLTWALYDNWDSNVLFEYGYKAYHIDIYGTNFDQLEVDAQHLKLGENSDDLFGISQDVSKLFWTLYKYELR